MLSPPKGFFAPRHSGKHAGSEMDVRHSSGCVFDHIPRLPQSVDGLIELLSRPTIDLSEISTLLSESPAWRQQLQWTCALSTLRPSLQKQQLEQWIALLGSRRIRSVVIGVYLAEHLVSHPSGLLQVLCEQCQFLADISWTLAHRSSFPEPEQAYVAGWLHGAGLLPFISYAQPDASRIPAWFGFSRDAVRWQNNQFHTDYRDLGRRMADAWNVPTSLSSHLWDSCRENSGDEFANLMSTSLEVCNLANTLPDVAYTFFDSLMSANPAWHSLTDTGPRPAREDSRCSDPEAQRMIANHAAAAKLIRIKG
ncbi:MAG: HDOD domain-containing protein [Acidobacteriia bacterium]|nr:HDOD domain-containing protein [Terriglobia bacterium]